MCYGAMSPYQDDTSDLDQDNLRDLLQKYSRINIQLQHIPIHNLQPRVA